MLCVFVSLHGLPFAYFWWIFPSTYDLCNLMCVSDLNISHTCGNNDALKRCPFEPHAFIEKRWQWRAVVVPHKYFQVAISLAVSCLTDLMDVNFVNETY